MAPTLFEQLGGESKLREIVNTFVDRVFDDVMIGFFFAKVSRDRIKTMEYEFAAQFLGAEVEYSGRPLAQAHGRHPIMGGQFARRKQILKEVLEEHHVTPAIIEAWMDHTESLRPLITSDAGSDCDPDLAIAKTRGAGHG